MIILKYRQVNRVYYTSNFERNISFNDLYFNLSILYWSRGPGGSTSSVFGLPNNSYKPITNTAWVCFVDYKKWCTRLAAASDKVYQLLAHGRCLSLGTPASSITNCGRHDIAEILLKVALNTIKIKIILVILHSSSISRASVYPKVSKISTCLKCSSTWPRISQSLLGKKRMGELKFYIIMLTISNGLKNLL